MKLTKKEKDRLHNLPVEKKNELLKLIAKYLK